MWKGVQARRKRRTKIPESLYHLAREDFKHGTNKNLDDFQIGWIGMVASFNGRMFKGYARKADSGRDYLMEHVISARNQDRGLKGVEFHNCNYWKLPIPKKSIIYCDPPYTNTTKYADEDFDHDKFWGWVRKMSLKGHQVFVSEYVAPDDFLCVLEIPTKTTMNSQNVMARVERLFVYEPTWKRKRKIKIPKLEL